RFLKDRRVRGHCAQAVFLSQTSELPAGDQIASDVVQPEGLTECSQYLQRIGMHLRVSLRSSGATSIAHPLDESDSSLQIPLDCRLSCASTIASAWTTGNGCVPSTKGDRHSCDSSLATYRH